MTVTGKLGGEGKHPNAPEHCEVVTPQLLWRLTNPMSRLAVARVPETTGSVTTHSGGV